MKQQIENKKKYENKIKIKRRQQRHGEQVTVDPKKPKRKLLITPTKNGFDSFEKDVNYMEAENEYKKNGLIKIIKKLNLDLECKEDKIKFICNILNYVKDINK